MRIVEKERLPKSLFNELPLGTCFKIEGEIYMKIESVAKDPTGRNFNSVDLKSGKVYTSSENTTCDAVNGYFVEE